MIRSGWGNASLRRLLLVSAVAILPVLAGCEAGNDAPTNQWHYPTDAAGTVAGDLAARNVFIVGAPLGSSLQPGQNASLFLSLFNSGASDRLLSITAPGSAASVEVPGGTILVTSTQPVLLNGPGTSAFLVHLLKPLTSGSSIKIVLHFQRAGAVTVQVPIFARAAHYVTYAPPPSPTPSASPATLRRRHKKVSATPAVGGATPSATPTPSAS